jgi:hypothetical protein
MVPGEIDLHQVRCRHLVIGEAVRIDQIVMVAIRHPRRDVVVDEIVEAEMVDQPIAGRKLDPHRPFGWRGLASDLGHRPGCGHAFLPAKSPYFLILPPAAVSGDGRFLGCSAVVIRL